MDDDLIPLCDALPDSFQPNLVLDVLDVLNVLDENIESDVPEGDSYNAFQYLLAKQEEAYRENALHLLAIRDRRELQEVARGMNAPPAPTAPTLPKAVKRKRVVFPMMARNVRTSSLLCSEKLQNESVCYRFAAFGHSPTLVKKICAQNSRFQQNVV